MKTPLSLPLVMLVMAAAVPRYAHCSSDKPFLMASLGDSITAATVADTSLVDDSLKMKALELSLGGADRIPDKLRTLLNMQNKDTYSWTSGLKISSQFVKLRTFLGLSPTPADGNGEVDSDGDVDGGDEVRASSSELVIANLAVPGDKAVDMVAQAQQLKKLMDSGKFAGLKYVTVLIGANDACHKVAPATFRAQLKQSLELVASIRQDEPIHVLVSAIPKIPDVGRPEIQNHTTLFGMTCGGLHKMINECPDLTTWTTQEEYQQGMAVVDGINEQIVGAAADASRDHPNMEVAYSSTMYSTPIPIDLMAVDCFHPNAKGQQLLSDKLWQDQHWFSGASPNML